MEAFRAGLRVLIVDDDLAWLRILEKMLKECSYEVTTCCLAREALHLLRERKDGFDIVISDVNMPDMDGFKLLEHVGLEMDLPVIMMSVDGETSRVMRGVQHGACDYLLKPIRMKELRNIWQHVLRKEVHKMRDIESYEKFEESEMTRSDIKKKRKDQDNNFGKRKYGYSSSEKKNRVLWTVDLRQKFVAAVNKIGIDKVGPKKILDLMSVPKLTRENVGSHLQKYRLYLSRLQKGNDRIVSFGAIKQTDLSLTDPFGSVTLQNCVKLQKMNSKQTLNQKTVHKFHNNDMKSIGLLPIQEPKTSSFRNTSDAPKTSSSRMCPIPNFKPLESNEKYASFDSRVSETYAWNEIPKEQFKIENVFNQVDHVPFAQSVGSRPFIAGKKKKTPIETETQEKVLKATHLLPIRVSEPIPSSSLSSNNHFFLYDSRSDPETHISESYSDFTYKNEDLFSLFQRDGNYKTNIELQNKEFCKPNIPDLFAETAGYPYQLEALLNTL